MKKDILEQFSDWMSVNSSLADSSIYKYKRAVNTISNEMVEDGTIYKDLLQMDFLELDIAISNILVNESFVKKNSVGNHMYSNALKQFRCFRRENLLLENVEQSKVEELVADSSLSQTEKQAIVKARVGQGKFRANLFKKYDGKCLITGIDTPQLLIASHIKPWAVCSNEERLDVENGLLLSPNMDRLFDYGLMSFTNKGEIILSSFVGNENAKRLLIEHHQVVDLKASDRLKYYLEYHRDVLFVK